MLRRPNFIVPFLLFSLTLLHPLNAQDVESIDSANQIKRRPFIEALTKRRNYLIAPQIDRSPETGFLTGIYWLQLFRGKKDTVSRTSNTETFLSVTEKKQFLFEFNETILLDHEKFILRGGSILAKYNEFFYGTGNDIDVHKRELVNLNFFQTNQRLTRALSKSMFLGIQYQNYQYWNIRGDNDSILERSTVLGKTSSFTSGAGPVFLYDTRDNVIYSTTGTYLDVSAIFAEGWEGSRYEFTNFILDARKFIPLYRRITFATQGLVNFNWGNVPYRQLALMGGDILMRGYYLGTFRDKYMMCAQAELRIPVYKFIGIILFAAVGEVQNRLDKFNTAQIRLTEGFGLRLMLIKHERVNVGGELGFSKNTKALYFGSGESF